MVTHGLGYLKKVDNIIVLKDGRISEMGTYNQLLSRKGAFSDLVTTYLEEKVHELREEDEDAEEGKFFSWLRIFLNSYVFSCR